jgi:hypothetical protein
MAISKEKKAKKNLPKVLQKSWQFQKKQKSLKCDQWFLKKKFQKVHSTTLHGILFFGSKLTNSHH